MSLTKYLHKDRDKPDPALGLDPKVVEVYTKSVLYTFSHSSPLTILHPQTKLLPPKIQIWTTPKNLQSHPLPPRLGTYARSHPPRIVVTARLSLGHQNIHIQHEAPTSAAVSRRRAFGCD